ncbi:hypothetical protein TorRG33x02_250280 [Trema orientale]|uniref:Uncharacterized protein n=1 Tax=Trema orientale TaxID=63057 RepID=A0A2P5DJ04_TREOI|nr:hypothetical protein TorRG33x02_250280 [Trema orientale]
MDPANEENTTQEQGKADLSRLSGRDNKDNRERERDNKDNLWCTYCKKPRDTKERCWKLHGKPPSQEWRNQRGQHKSQAHHSGGQERGDFNSQEIEKLRNLIGSLEMLIGTLRNRIRERRLDLLKKGRGFTILKHLVLQIMSPILSCPYPFLVLQIKRCYLALPFSYWSSFF